jgi:hypothetical protein
MYCLILFYLTARTELAPIRPVPKFLCIKVRAPPQTLSGALCTRCNSLSAVLCRFFVGAGVLHVLAKVGCALFFCIICEHSCGFGLLCSALISILVKMGVILDNGTYTAENVGEGLQVGRAPTIASSTPPHYYIYQPSPALCCVRCAQDFLICIEMFVASVAHVFAFSVDGTAQDGAVCGLRANMGWVCDVVVWCGVVGTHCRFQ